MKSNEGKILVVVGKDGVNKVKIIASSVKEEREILGIYSKIQQEVNRFIRNTEKCLRT